jgi:lipopolysaccharide export system permease protein
MHPDMNDPSVKFQEGRYRSELHDRFSGPLYALAFGMIAFAALSQPRTTRSGNWKAMVAAFAAVAAVRGAGFAVSGFVTKSAAWIPADYVVPAIGLAGALLYIFAPRFSLPRRRGGAMRLPVPQAA